MIRIRTKLLMSLVLLLQGGAAVGATWYVNGVSGSDSHSCTSPTLACETIGHAISRAASGDSITVAPAIYTENLSIALSLNLIGSSASTTVIDGGSVNRVLMVSSGNVTLSGFTLRNGSLDSVASGASVYNFGAGIYNSANLLVLASTITGNLAAVTCPGARSFVRCSAAGGGIYNSSGAELTIRNSTIAANTVRGGCRLNPCSVPIEGGGVYNQGALIVSNTTFTQNTVQSTGGMTTAKGGGISNHGVATMSSTTISGNVATIGGAILNNPGSQLTLQNSLLGPSSPIGRNCAGTIISNGYNLSSDESCNLSRAGDLNNRNAMLGPLQSNGGSTQTMALPPGSPAIDGGNPGGCTDGQGQLLKTDQRGMPRPDSEDKTGCDMGAFESQTD